MWEIEYVQCPRGNTWSFRFDHVPIDDGRWHTIRVDSPTYYRVEHDAIQFCTPRGDVPQDVWKGLLGDLQRGGPIPSRSEIELVIAEHDGHVWISSPRFERAGERILERLLHDDVADAYAALKRADREA